MVVESGNPPYDYGIITPLRSLDEPNNIGISGTLLEQAMFVVQAELRRWNITFTPAGDYRIYTHPDIASVPFEPSADGANLINSQIEVNNISEIRDQFFALLGDYAGDANISDEDFLTDWIRQAYPDSPSGNFPFVFFGTQLRGIFLRPRLGGQVKPGQSFGPSLETGRILTTDLHWLGGSGVFFDIDVGEIMWNPYPHIRQDGLDNFHKSSQGSWNLHTVPLWPRFQKLDGSLIGVSDRDRDARELISDQQDTDVDPTSSGAVRLDGYVMRPTSDYKLGLGEFGFSATTDFTFAERGARSISEAPSFIDHLLPTSRVFITPTVQTSGVYRIVVQNRKVNLPTTLESGIMSQYPVLAEIADIGYEVFDDCLWATDVGRATISTSNVASGLSVVSPFTGDLLWLRHAENPPDINFPHADHWGRGLGLERISAIRVQRFEASGSPPFTDTFTLRMMEWNDALDYQTFINVTLTGAGIGTDITVSTLDMCFNGTEYYILGQRSAGQGRMWKLNSSLVETDESGFPGASGIQPRFRGIGTVDGGQQVGFALLGWSSFLIPKPQRTILPFFISAGAMTFGIPKILQNSWGDDGFTEIHDIITVTGSAHLPDGVWAFVIHETAFFSARRLYLLHIEELSSTWGVKGEILINGSAGSTTLHRQILFNDIN